MQINPNMHGTGTSGVDIKFNPKPKYSPTISKWKRKGGKVDILEDGTYKYTDWEGNIVEYKDGYPDFSPYERQRVEIQQEGNYTTDFTDANKASNLKPPKLDENTWHHHENGTTMQEIPTDIHSRFTHRGGVSSKKGKK